MGKELYENHSRFKFWMDHCDEILHPLLQTSMLNVLYQGSNDKYQPFNHILHSNPALIAIEYSLAQVLMESSIEPDFLLGYSLGEITASVIAGGLSIEDGLAIAVDIARLTEQETSRAGMLAIIDSVEIMNDAPDMFDNCWITCRNFDRNFVVSGLFEDILTLKNALDQKSITSQVLPVDYGFHTKLLDPIESALKQKLRQIKMSPTNIPLISSYTSDQVENVPATYFWEVIRYTVDFETTIKSMLHKGDYIFIDVGPSGTLATSVKYLLPSISGSCHFEVMNQFGKNLISLDTLKSNLDAMDPVILM